MGHKKLYSWGRLACKRFMQSAVFRDVHQASQSSLNVMTRRNAIKTNLINVSRHTACIPNIVEHFYDAWRSFISSRSIANWKSIKRRTVSERWWVHLIDDYLSLAFDGFREILLLFSCCYLHPSKDWGRRNVWGNEKFLTYLTAFYSTPRLERPKRRSLSLLHDPLFNLNSISIKPEKFDSKLFNWEVLHRPKQIDQTNNNSIKLADAEKSNCQSSWLPKSLNVSFFSLSCFACP